MQNQLCDLKSLQTRRRQDACVPCLSEPMEGQNNDVALSGRSFWGDMKTQGVALG